VRGLAFGEYTGEDGVDVGELAVDVEGGGDFFGAEAGCDFGVGFDEVAVDEGCGFVDGGPGVHGVGLDEAVGVFAGDAGFGEVEQELAAVDEAAGELEVFEHAGGVDEEFFDEGGRFVEHVVGEDGGVGQDDALGGGVGDVALVPEGYVFEGDLSVAADDASQAADVFAGDGVALVGHGAGALLFGGEELFGFADFGALEVADLGGDLVERGTEDGQRGDVGGVAVALQDLRGDGGGGEAEFGEDGLFVFGLELAEGADGAGDLADAEVFGGGIEATEVAAHLGVPEQELHAEGGGFGVDTVGAADGGGVLELDGTGAEDVSKTHDAGADEGGGLGESEGLGGVDDVGGGEAVVQPAGGIAAGLADGFGHGSSEGEDIVTGVEFDLVDARDGEVRMGAKFCGGCDGDDAGFGKSIGGGEFDAQPVAIFAVFRPDDGHLRTSVASDQRELLRFIGTRLVYRVAEAICGLLRWQMARRRSRMRAFQACSVATR